MVANEVGTFGHQEVYNMPRSIANISYIPELEIITASLMIAGKYTTTSTQSVVRFGSTRMTRGCCSLT